MNYKLTPIGENRARRVDAVDGPESAVLVLLYEERDPMEFEEIAGETNMSDSTTQRVLSHLVSSGYIKELQ